MTNQMNDSNVILQSLKPSKKQSGQCLNKRCGWSGRWRDEHKECPRCGKALQKFPSEAAGWKAYHEQLEAE